jgi:hypothetical protein
MLVPAGSLADWDGGPTILRPAAPKRRTLVSDLRGALHADQLASSEGGYACNRAGCREVLKAE